MVARRAEVDEHFMAVGDTSDTSDHNYPQRRRRGVRRGRWIIAGTAARSSRTPSGNIALDAGTGGWWKERNKREKNPKRSFLPRREREGRKRR